MNDNERITVDFDAVRKDIEKTLEVLGDDISSESKHKIAEAVIKSYTDVTVEHIKGFNALAEEVSRRNTKDLELNHEMEIKRLECQADQDRARGMIIGEGIRAIGTIIGIGVNVAAGNKLALIKLAAQQGMLTNFFHVMKLEESGDWMSESKTGSSMINTSVSSLTRKIMED